MTTESTELIVILTGAGISKESGLETFRDEGGLWSRVRIEDVATPEAYARDPVRVLEFYNMRRASMTGGNIRPNAAHAALARLERDWPGDVLLVTQNIDDLHEKAGSENLLHMHGEMLKVRCEHCQEAVTWEGTLGLEDSCTACGTTGRMRPHVVWFGEMPFYMEEIYAALDRCDLFISIGTSGNVYPAAGFVQHVRMGGRGHTVELNMEPSEGATLFAEAKYGPATELVPAYVDRLLQEGL
ncbi:MAG: NAD-dependent deacylase [Rhodospirillaceae bacterium]|jgi:NAD-dependent deacetylase|nr:NAD-dependent deacylase [Rhodospirillaceae bacterium]